MKIYIHGNCQSAAIKKMMLEADPTLDVSNYVVSNHDMLDYMDDYTNAVETADVIILQPISNNYRNESRLSLRWINEHRKRASKIILIPSIYFNGYHPQIIPVEGLAVFHFMPYIDVHVLDLHCRGLSPDLIKEKIDAEGFLNHDLVRSDCFSSLAELVRRETQSSVDVKVSDFIFSRYRHTILFNSCNHPGRELMVYVTSQILSQMGLDVCPQSSGFDHLCSDVINIYPSTSVALDLDIQSPAYQDTVVGQGQSVPLLDYIRASTAFYEKEDGKDRIWQVFNGNKATAAYLARHYKTLARSLDAPIYTPRMTQEFATSLYQVLLMRDPDPDGLESNTRHVFDQPSISSLIERILNSEEFSQKLPQFLEKFVRISL